ncbi:hypothetical protein [Martelella radicis]|uniref:Ribosomal protein L40E n=1 Tax=Martelella radicis TaxID=1397476 RepID=A0A7W6KNM8_9HYPH|nr:hypothetical protein [Martelella radicis]MBB4124518.1 ribosomal protein L40E [Martelella radicis]
MSKSSFVEKAQGETKICQSCGAKIAAEFPICSSCGTRQHPFWRPFFRISGTLAAILVVVSFFTTAAALAPQMWATFFPDPEPHLLRLVFDSSDIGKRKFAGLELANTGNVDVYVIAAEFRPSEAALADLGDLSIAIRKTIKSGEILDTRIAMIGTHVGARRAPAPVLILPQYYPVVRELVHASGRPLDRCFILAPQNAFVDVGSPENGDFRYAEALTRLEGQLIYYDPEDLRSRCTARLRNLYLEGSIYLEQACLEAIGGQSAMFQAIGKAQETGRLSRPVYPMTRNQYEPLSHCE